MGPEAPCSVQPPSHWDRKLVNCTSDFLLAPQDLATESANRTRDDHLGATCDAVARQGSIRACGTLRRRRTSQNPPNCPQGQRRGDASAAGFSGRKLLAVERASTPPPRRSTAGTWKRVQRPREGQHRPKPSSPSPPHRVTLAVRPARAHREPPHVSPSSKHASLQLCSLAIIAQAASAPQRSEPNGTTATSTKPLGSSW